MKRSPYAKKTLLDKLSRSDLFHYFYSSVGLIFAIGLVLIFQRIAGSLDKPRLLYIDQGLYEIARSVASPNTDFVFTVLTFLGSNIVVVPLMLIAVFFLIRNRFRRAAFVLFFSTTSTLVINSLLKSVFVRNRPTETGYNFLWQDYSFPSGHTMIATVFYGLLGYMVITFEKNPTRKLLFFIFFTSIILAVGGSRISLGVHYFSDVAAAYAVGGFWTIWNIYIIKIFYQK